MNDKDKDKKSDDKWVYVAKNQEIVIDTKKVSDAIVRQETKEETKNDTGNGTTKK